MQKSNEPTKKFEGQSVPFHPLQILIGLRSLLQFYTT